MNNNRKRHFHFYSHASKDQVFTLLDAVKSDNEDEIDELINDLDMEFIAPGDMKLTDNSGNVSNLTLEANADVVDQGNTRTKELETSNKRKKKARRTYPDHTKMQRFSTFSREEGRVIRQFDASASGFDIYEKILNLDVLIEILVQKSNSIRNKTGGSFSPMRRK